VRTRQEAALTRELDRIDTYFEGYASELTARASRGIAESAKTKLSERLIAAKAQQNRHRADQAARHEIRIIPQVDALILVAEPAWRAQLEIVRGRAAQLVVANFTPRARRWEPFST